MKKLFNIKTLCGLATVLFFSMGSVTAQNGDACNNAKTINCLDGTLDGNTADGWTTNPNEGLICPITLPGTGLDMDPAEAAYWYLYNEPVRNDVSITVTGVVGGATGPTDLISDPNLSVYSGSCGALSCVGFSSDVIGTTAILNVLLEANTDYWFMVSGNGFYFEFVPVFQTVIVPTAEFSITIACVENEFNDDCFTAQPIVCGTVLSGSTTDALPEDISNCGYWSGTNAVWYSVVGNGDIMVASTCNQANYDTQIGIFTAIGGNCGLGMNCVTSNDDGPGCSGFTSEVQWGSVSGETYLIMVSGFNGADGDFDLSLDCLAPPSNNTCATAEDIACGGTASGSTTSASGGPSLPTCGTSQGSAGSVWYSLIGDGTTVTANTTGSNYDTKMWVWTGDCNTYTCVTGNDDGGPGLLSQVTFGTVAGVVYYIQVGGFSSSAGNYTLNIVSCVAPPPNDFCADAIPIQCNATLAGTTEGASLDAVPFCGTTQSGGSVWYDFIGTGEFIIATTSSQVNTNLSVFTGPSCGLLSCVGGDAGFPNAEFFFQANLGQQYWVMVHADNTAGAFGVNLECIPPPENDGPCDVENVPLVLGVGSVTFSNLGATADVDEVNPGSGTDGISTCESQNGWCSFEVPEAHNSIWYTFTVPPSGCVSIETHAGATSANLQLALWQADDCSDWSTYTEVAANDNTGAGTQALIMDVACLDINGTYLIQVDGYNGAIAIDHTLTITDCGGDPLSITATGGCQTSFIGYEPALDTNYLQACAAGGLLPYTYEWSIAPDPNAPPPPVVDLTLDLNTDNFGGETSWTLVQDNGDIIANAAQGSLSSNTNYNETYQVCDNSEYTFTIEDSFGDGICCSYGTGSYTITLDGVVVVESNVNNNAFTGNIQTETFGVAGGGCAGAGGGGTVGLYQNDNLGDGCTNLAVQPDSSTIYIATVTDARGCVATVEVVVNVFDMDCSNNPNSDKVIICHNGNTLCISANGAANHLASHSDDFFGDCGNPCLSVNAPFDPDWGIEQCGSGGAFGEGQTITDVITVSNDAGWWLTDMTVSVEIQHTWVSELNITLTSPTGTEVTLWGNQCGSNDNIDIDFNDAFGPVACGNPTAGEFHPSGNLSDFEDEVWEGDWTLTVADDPSFGGGTLVAWCIDAEVQTPPTDCNGIVGGPDQIGNPCDDGDANTFNDRWSEDCECIGDPPCQVCCDMIDTPLAISSTLPPVVDVVEANWNEALTGLAISVDINHTWAGDLDITLTSPSGTSVVIFNDGCGSSDFVPVTFEDGAAPYTCQTPGTFAPSNPLSTFIGENYQGNWTLTVDDNVGGDDGTLNGWCLLPSFASDPDCNGVAGGPDQPGTPCDDGDAGTLNDTWNAMCVCVGVPPCDPLNPTFITLSVVATYDFYSGESSFLLHDATAGVDVAFVGGVSGGSQTIVYDYCVDPDHCYEFTGYDSFGDGGLGYVVTLGAQSISGTVSGTGGITHEIGNCAGAGATAPSSSILDGELEASIAAYPNPTTSITNMQFSVPNAGNVDVALYTMDGRKVMQIFNGNVEAGAATVVDFDASDLPSGVYIYQLISNDELLSGRLQIIR